MCCCLFLLKLLASGLQQRIFPVTIAKFIMKKCFYRSLLLATFYCSNQTKIIQEITASKFQGKHATLFNIYQGLCPATKSGIHRGFSNGILRHFRKASFQNNLGKENRGGEWPSWFQVLTFSRAVIYQAVRQCSLLEKFSHSGKCVKSVQIQSFFWAVFSSIWKNSIFEHFSRSESFQLGLCHPFLYT